MPASTARPLNAISSIGAVDQTEAAFDAVEPIVNSVEPCIEPRELSADMRHFTFERTEPLALLALLGAPRGSYRGRADPERR
jgi:hypothetical protein